MIIGIDASKAAEKKRTGVENFVYQLILHLSMIDSKNTYYLFTNKSLPKELLGNKNFNEVLIPFPKFWNKLRLPLGLLQHKPEVFLAPSYMIPAFAPKKSLAVVHDLAYAKFPEAYSKKERLFQRTTLKNIVRKAQKIVCVSNSTKNDLENLIPETKTSAEVIYLGINSAIKPEGQAKDILGLGSKYFLALGRLEKRKNTKNIIEAFSKLKDLGFNYKLVLAGQPSFGIKEIEEAIKQSGYAEDIVITGYLPDEKLNDLLNGAEALVYPSLYEGFGMPVLEAMQAGIPVITSNTSALPEIADDAALLVDPNDINDICKAMKSVASNTGLRSELVQKGLKQAKKFSWDKTAKEYLKLMEEM